MEKPIKIKLHVLSPIHIGCDCVFEPTSFVIDETKKKLIEFDPMDYVEALTVPQREELIKKCENGDLLQIFQFIKRTYKHGIPTNEVNIASGLLEHYKTVLSMRSYNKNTIINQFTMNKTAHNTQTRFVYVPGSSLKGAMRTGYLSSLAVISGIRGEKNKKALEETLLGGSFGGGFGPDPFRMIKVSDLQPFSNVQTKILYGINRKKKTSDKPTKAENGPPQIFEAIEQGSIFEGAININTPDKNADIKQPIDKNKLLTLMHRHYRTIYEQEEKVLEDCGFKQIPIEGFQKHLGKTCFLVRIGRHSGAEAVTIEGNRNIKIMQAAGEKKYLPYSTTLWLASETRKPLYGNALVPFGWAILEEITNYDTGKGIYSTCIDKSVPSNVRPIENRLDNVIEKPPIRKQPERILWKNVHLSWNPGNQTVTATNGPQKAEVKGMDRSLVPTAIAEKLFNPKKKAAVADILVEPVGNAFKIVSFTEDK